MCIFYIILIFVLLLDAIGDVLGGDDDVLGGTDGVVWFVAFTKDIFTKNHFYFRESKESLGLLSEVCTIYVNIRFMVASKMEHLIRTFLICFMS